MKRVPSPPSEARRIYAGLTARRTLFLALCGSALVLSFVADVMTGPSFLSVKEAVAGLLAWEGTEATHIVIVREVRLPVAAMALSAGAALGLAGAEMQTILNNPLASPYTLGISAAAGFGAGLATVLGAELAPGIAAGLVPFAAFVFALSACLGIYGLAKAKNASAETIILAGIALMFLFNALTALLQYHATVEQLQAMVFWLFGSLQKADWPKTAVTAAVLGLLVPVFVKDAWRLTALRLGDAKAEALGVNTEALRLRTMVAISFITATAVCFVGTIGFIGLVAPHVARVLVGEDQRFFFPFSAFCGALFLSLASIGSKMLSPGAVYPVGIITAFLGVPFFLGIVLGRKKENW